MDTLGFHSGSVWVELYGDDRICEKVRAGNPFEPETLQAWADFCQPGTVAIDVGAYSGLFSIVAAKRGARAIAVEPLPVMQKRIADNAALNEVEIEVIAGAASDATGEANIRYNDRVHLTSGASLLLKNGLNLRIRTFRLDHLEIQGPVSVMKIDVERHELAVLEGASELIVRDRPHLIVEFLDAKAKEAIIKMLPGYTVRAVTDVRNMIMSPRE
jgi:FkbM family methyltransferase